MSTLTSRRAFLRGYVAPDDPAALRPPGAVADGFATLCTRCGDCARACPEGIIILPNGQRPEVDFRRGECTFCGDCAAACGDGALDPALVAAWPWRAFVTTGCLSLNGVSCRACQDACEAVAIRFRLVVGGSAEPLIDAATCTGCGACSHACPAHAIGFERLSKPQPSEVTL